MSHQDEWSNNLRREPAWAGMAAGLAAFFLSIVLTADVLISHRHSQSCCKNPRQAIGASLLLLCRITALAFIFATAMTGKDIYDITGYVDSNDHTEDVVCSPNGLWYVALGLSFVGFLACVLACCLIEFQFQRSNEASMDTEGSDVDDDEKTIQVSKERDEIIDCESLLKLNHEDLLQMGWCPWATQQSKFSDG